MCASHLLGRMPADDARDEIYFHKIIIFRSNKILFAHRPFVIRRVLHLSVNYFYCGSCCAEKVHHRAQSKNAHCHLTYDFMMGTFSMGKYFCSFNLQDHNFQMHLFIILIIIKKYSSQPLVF